VGEKGGIKEKLGRERTGNPKKGTYQTYSTSSDRLSGFIWCVDVSLSWHL